MRQILIFIIISFLFLACISFAEAGQEALPEKVSVNDHANRAHKTSDDKFLEVSAKVPGFGGMFIDGDIMKVYLLNPVQKHEAEAGIASVFGQERIPQGGVQVLQGQYSYSQLKKWHGSMGTVFNIPGVIFTDVDESSNRLKIGVESTDSFGPIEHELIKQGIPRGAFVIEKVEPIVYVYTLQEYMRPIQGGIQIRFSDYLCTLGFNGVRSGTSGFVVNSHCTNTQGSVDDTKYYQPLLTTPEYFIGTEIADPMYFTEGCYAGSICRWSDAAYAARADGVQADIGLIARPDGINTRSLDIAGNFRIMSDEGDVLVGDLLNKVGRTTGWTQGIVTATCVDTGVSGTNIVQLCQTHVRAGVGGGDSGSPVFRITDPDNYDIQLLGILWGGSANGRSFVYSPMTNIESELGPIDTTNIISDTTPPVITNVNSIDITNSSATITWTTDENSDSEVNYGNNTLLGTNEFDSAYVTTHSIILTGLASETKYYYEVNSTDSSGNKANDNNSGEYYNFTTTSDTPLPGNEMHIFDIFMDLDRKDAGRKTFTWALATITVVDSSNNPVPGAQVTGTWSGLTSDSDTATTEADGNVTVRSDSVKDASGTYTFTVNDIGLTGWTYNESANTVDFKSISVS